MLASTGGEQDGAFSFNLQSHTTTGIVTILKILLNAFYC